MYNLQVSSANSPYQTMAPAVEPSQLSTSPVPSPPTGYQVPASSLPSLQPATSPFQQIEDTSNYQPQYQGLLPLNIPVPNQPNPNTMDFTDTVLDDTRVPTEEFSFLSNFDSACNHDELQSSFNSLNL